jgi:hypothetical protein
MEMPRKEDKASGIHTKEWGRRLQNEFCRINR